jgi:hypothetical protein
MHEMSVFKPIYKDSLSKEERMKELESLMILKGKQNKLPKQGCVLMDESSEGIGRRKNLCHPLYPQTRFLSLLWSMPTNKEMLDATTYPDPEPFYMPIHTRTRLVIPVLTGIFFGAQKQKKNRIPEDFFFFCVFRRIFSQERHFVGVVVILVSTSLPT